MMAGAADMPLFEGVRKRKRAVIRDKYSCIPTPFWAG
jgi:hypothetical protein